MPTTTPNPVRDDAPPRAPRARPRWRGPVTLALLVPAAMLACALLLAGLYALSAIPLPGDITAAESVVYDHEGNEVGSLSPRAARQDVTLSALPAHVPAAVMAAEDRGFYRHDGISLSGVARAIFVNATAGEIRQGGSTITQQYVKNAIVGSERSLVRKAKEAVLAMKIERQLSKDQILEHYLNTIYWGRGAYGIEAAAQTYYGLSATDLSLNQAATLAGMIQAPENLDPREAPEAADDRRRYVLDGMVEGGWLEPTLHREVVAAGLPDVSERATADHGPAAYFIDAVRRDLIARLGGERGAYSGLRVHTTLDVRAQEIAQRALTDGLGGAATSGAVVTIDPATGAIVALVGGPDFAAQQVNTAIRTTNTPGRQPGSSFKPFTLTALVAGGVSPESRFEAPAELQVESAGGPTTVGNYGGHDHGVQTVREATWTSTNTVYMQLIDLVGAERVAETARALGLGDAPELPAVPSLTLGTASVTPVEMASAYATLAAGGLRTPAALITRIESAEGEVLFEADVEQTQVLPANDAAIVTDVLRGVIAHGTGRGADIGRPAAGKTGTTDDYRDAWFVGFTPQYATAVWVGNLDNSPMAEVTGGSVPANIWSSYMAALHDGLEVLDFPPPDLSGKDVLNPAPEPGATPGPSASPTECPDDEDSEATGAVPAVLEAGEDDRTRTCEPAGGPSPSASPSPASSPEPTREPTSEPSPQPEPSPEPSPTTEDG